jgi:hypothetical protein
MSYVTINTPLPTNITPYQLEKYFKPIAKAEVKIPSLREINHSFVSHQGLVLKNGLLADGCALNLSGHEDNTFYYPFWRNTIEQYLVCRFGKSLRSVKLNGNEKFLLIHSRWFNYAFWINCYLPRLIMAEQTGRLRNMKLIFPEGWKKLHYVTQSLEAFNIECEVVPNDHHLFVKRLILPETREWTNSFYPPHVQGIRERLVPEAFIRCAITSFPKKIYLTRKQRGVRCVENEQEVLACLTEFGFKAVVFENLSFWEQVKMMSEAEAFVSLHGAGFANYESRSLCTRTNQ